MQLYDFQKNAANFIINRLKQNLPVLDCSVVGAGKTFIALYALKQLQRKFIIICPKIVISHWKDSILLAEIESLCLDVVNYEKIKFGKTDYFTDNKWKLQSNTIILFDEAHKLKGYNTFNSKLLLHLPLNIATPYLISATIADSPIDFVNVAKAFRITSNEYKFLNEFGYSKKYNNRGWKFDNDYRHLTRLHDIIFNNINHPGVRITYDMITILNKTNTISLLPITDIYNRIEHLYQLIIDPNIILKTKLQDKLQNDTFYSLMNEAENVLLNTFDTKLIDRIEQTILFEYSDDALVRRLRLKQFIELIKTRLIVSRVINDYNNGASIVIMLNYSWSIDLLYKSLKSSGINDIGLITGCNKDRDDTIRNFQQDKLRIIILNIKAASVGISLHDTRGYYNRISYISPSDNIYELQQALGRIYRATSQSNVHQYFITVIDSIEMDVYQNYINKLNMMSKLLNGKNDLVL